METAPTVNPSTSPSQGPWRGVLLGAAAGALLGAVVGWMYSRQSPDPQRQPLAALGPLDFVKLGVILLSTARQLGEFVQRA